ncbi:hypothetical protein AMECASPLE_037460 [Ameca splendens]|uniref:Uncharacterized protein n=1 Tax=Ameca splendens TaxID=208324 RepID=A0ABV0XWS6_9TELE
MKHLNVHGINLRAESCSVFDCKKSGPQPAQQPVGNAKPERSDSKSPPPDSTSSESTEDGTVSGISTVASDPDVRTRPVSVNPFTLAEKGKMPKERQDQCHRAVTNFVVKGLLPFSIVEAPWWR